ncbi:MAG: hypothetical protein ABIM30_01225 [candidate division WOR-3 bacterium]
MDLKKFLEQVKKYPEIKEEEKTYTLPQYENFIKKVYADQAIDEALNSPDKLTGLRTEKMFNLPELDKAMEEQNLAKEGSYLFAEKHGKDQRNMLNKLAEFLAEKLDPSLSQNKKVMETYEEAEDLVKRKTNLFSKLYDKNINVNIFPREKYKHLRGFVDKRDPNTINLSDRLLADPENASTILHEIMHTVYPSNTFGEDINQVPPDATSYHEYLAKVQKGHFENDPEEMRKKGKQYKYGSPGVGYEIFKQLLEKLK